MKENYVDNAIKILDDLAKKLREDGRPFESMDIQTACDLIKNKVLSAYIVTANVDNGTRKYITKVVLPADSPEQASESARIWLSAGYDTTCQILEVNILDEPIICEI